MTGVKTIRVTGVNHFDTASFLRRMHSAGLTVSLLIYINRRTEIYLSVVDDSILGRKEDLKMGVLKSLLENCTCEDSDAPSLQWRKLMLHVVGEPQPQADAIEALVSKFLSSEIEAFIIMKAMPLQEFFAFSFAVAVPFTDRRHGTVITLSALLKAALGETIRIRRRKTSHDIRRIIMESGPFMLLDMETASRLFHLPLTYGITTIMEMGFPTPPSPLKGIRVGTPAEFSLPDLREIRLDPERLFEHMAVWGASGTGKTTFLKNLLISLESTGIKFCILDWHSEYREIISSLRRKIGKGILVLNPFISSLSVNPLELPHNGRFREMLIWERIENFISLLNQMFRIGEIQEAHIRNILSKLYMETDTPTIGELVSLLSDRHMKTLAMKLKKFTEGFYGKIFNSRKSTLPMQKLREKNVIIELGRLPPEVRMFFACIFLILWWESLQTGSITSNVLVLDDFYRYSQLSVIRKMLSEARKFRQGLICSHQGPYQLPEGIREEVVRNTATKIIFRQEQTWDKYIVRDALGGLTKEQIENLSYLRTGEAIIKLPSTNFPIRIDTLPPAGSTPPDDEEIKEAMKNFIQTGTPETTAPAETIERKMLREIHRNPGTPLTEIAKTLKIKTSRGYQLKNSLLQQGYLEEEKVRTGRGRPRIILKITPEGYQYLGEKERKTAPQYGKTEHRLMVSRVASMLKGWNIKIEDGCDIRAEKNGFRVAIEIETDRTNQKQQILYNVRRDLTWADRVIIICPNKDTKIRIAEMLQAESQKTIIITYRQINRIHEILRM